ncbi:MAG: hypothetical protein AAFQ82_14455, partial [Myxococcota bacterium]
IALPCDNPSGEILVEGTTLYLACSGNFSANGNGGVVSVNTSNASTRIEATDTELGGYPNGLARIGNALFTLVAIPGAEPFTTLEMRAVRLLEDQAPETLYSAPGFSLAGLAVNSTTLFVGNRSSDGSEGIYPVDLASASVGERISTDVPPFDLAVR